MRLKKQITFIASLTALACIGGYGSQAYFVSSNAVVNDPDKTNAFMETDSEACAKGVCSNTTITFNPNS